MTPRKGDMSMLHYALLSPILKVANVIPPRTRSYPGQAGNTPRCDALGFSADSLVGGHVHDNTVGRTLHTFLQAPGLSLDDAMPTLDLAKDSTSL